MSKNPVLGIDLGTRYALMSVCSEGSGNPEILPNRWGRTRTPSIVAWEDGRFFVGEEAQKKLLRGCPRAWWNVKSHIGDSSWKVMAGTRHYRGEELLIPLLVLLREDAEAHLGIPLVECVLAVPAHFSFSERASMVRVARSAGFGGVRIINEPTAAALAVEMEGRSLVLDFGAGTVDITVMEQEEKIWQVLQSRGRDALGGASIDILLAHFLWERMGNRKLSEKDLRWPLLLSEAEKIKITLSNSEKMEWYPPGGLVENSQNLPLRIFRKELEELMEPLLNEVLSMVSQMWEEHRPDRLLLVGGSSRLPLLREKLRNQVTEPAHLGLYPDEVVALGAGMHGLGGSRRLLIDVLSRDLGVESSWGQMVPLLFQGTPLPCGASKTFEAPREGAVEIGVLQGGEGSAQEKLGTIRVEHLNPREEVEILFEVDSGGLLQMEVRRQDGSVAMHEILETSGKEGEKGQSRNFGDHRYRNMEKRCAKISMHLNEEQQQRMQRLLDRLLVLRSHRDAWEAGFREMEVFLAKLEEVCRS